MVCLVPFLLRSHNNAVTDTAPATERLVTNLLRAGAIVAYTKVCCYDRETLERARHGRETRAACGVLSLRYARAPRCAHTSGRERRGARSDLSSSGEPRLPRAVQPDGPETLRLSLEVGS